MQREYSRLTYGIGSKLMQGLLKNMVFPVLHFDEPSTDRSANKPDGRAPIMIGDTRPLVTAQDERHFIDEQGDANPSCRSVPN